MSFQHDIAGGQGNLIIAALQSPNFQHLVQGWQIARDGSAEFNDLTIRGVFDGNDFEINASGIFFYSSTPSHGNLTFSIASTSGTDQFNNPYRAGFTAYAAGGGSVNLSVDVANQPALEFRPSGVVHPGAFPPEVWGTVVNPGAGNESQVLNLYSGDEGTHNANAKIQLTSAANDGSLGSSLLAYIDGNFLLYANSQVFQTYQPLYGVNPNTNVVDEGTQFPSLMNGWGAPTSAAYPFYQMMNDGTVFISGQIGRSTAMSGSSQVFQMPAGYFNPSTAAFGTASVMNPSSPFTTTAITTYVSPSGALELFGNYPAAYYVNLNMRYKVK